MPLEEVYNIIVNDHHKVRTIDELRARLAHDASYNPMYAVVYQKFDKQASRCTSDGGASY